MKEASSPEHDQSPGPDAPLAESEYLVLHCLASSEETTSTAKQIAQRLACKPYNRPDLTPLTVSTVLGRLASRGFVHRLDAAEGSKAVGRPGLRYQSVDPLAVLVERRARRALWSVAFGETSSLQIVRAIVDQALKQTKEDHQED